MSSELQQRSDGGKEIPIIVHRDNSGQMYDLSRVILIDFMRGADESDCRKLESAGGTSALS